MNEETYIMCFSSTRCAYFFTHLNLKYQTISHFDYSLSAMYLSHASSQDAGIILSPLITIP